MNLDFEAWIAEVQAQIIPVLADRKYLYNEWRAGMHVMDIVSEIHFDHYMDDDDD